MTVYVSQIEKGLINPYAEPNGIDGCYMIADTASELHKMAAVVGLTSNQFRDKGQAKFDHYCLTKKRRDLAITNGAVEIGEYEFGIMTGGKS